MEKKVFGKPGFCIVNDIQRPPAELVTKLGEIPVAVIGDGLGRHHVMDSGIKPLDPSFRIAGPAITVEVHPADNLMIHVALKLAKEGDVIVVNTRGDTDHGVFGDIMNNLAKRKKLGGFIVDGSVRDCTEIIESGFPVFSRGVGPLGSGKEGPGQVNMPISCAGINVNPGDVIIGDADGVVVIPANMLQTALDGAKKKLAAEDKRIKAIQSGADDEIYPAWLIPTLRAKGVLGEEETI